MAEEYDTRDVAILAYHAAIEEIAEIQQRMALRTMLMHGDKALPQTPWRRRIHSYNVLRNAGEQSQKELVSDEVRLRKLYAIVTDLEVVFAEHRDAESKAFGKAMGEYVRRRQ